MTLFKRLMKDWWWLLLTVVIGSTMVINIARSSWRAIIIRGEISKLETQARDYQRRIDEDSTLIERLKSDDFLEKFAREQHNMQHSNEDVYIIEE